MTGSLQKTQGELDALVQTLEQRVEERTRELREAQAQLIQTEKLASLGRLSASIAHEINNPLSGILTYAKLLSRKLRTGPPDPEGVQTFLQQLALIERETQRCSTIVRNLLDFARQREPAFQDLEVPAVIEEAISLIANRMSIQNLKLVREIEPTPPVRADLGQLRQAMVNILINACDAMPEGGALSVATHAGGSSGMTKAAGTGPATAGWVEIVVRDRGQGIPAEHLSKVFDPFFTTKERGAGLGLSVVYGIVEKHGGKITMDSRVGEGTTVTIRLPVAAATAL
jgi:two-component system NtrC family sensor kinase